MTAPGSLARAGLIVTAAFFVARVLGGVRGIVIAARFGATGDVDPFFIAFGIPDLIFQLVAAGALSSALIPIVAALIETDGEARGWKVASTVVNLMMIVLAVLAMVMAIAAPAIVPWLAPDYRAPEKAVQLEKAVELTRIMLASPVLLALGAFATSLLNARNRFSASVLAPIVYNLAIIGGAVFLAPTIGVYGLAVGVVAGSACHLAVQLLPLRSIGYRYAPRIDLADPRAREALLLMVPRAVGLAASQLTFLVARALATGLVPGAVAAFGYAFSVFQIPIGVIGIPIGVVMLPSLSRDLAAGDVARYASLVTRALRLILWVMLPLAGLTIVLRREVVSFIYAWGRFGERDIDLVTSALVLLVLALASESLIAILARAFYAGRDTLTPVLAAITAVVVNVSLAFVLVGSLGLAGIGLAIAVGSWVEVALLLMVLGRRVTPFHPLDVIRPGLVSGAAAVLASAAALLVLTGLRAAIGADPGKLMVLVELVLSGGVGGLLYVGASRALHIPELVTIVRLMSTAVRRSPIS